MLPSSQSGVGRCTWKSIARGDTGSSYRPPVVASGSRRDDHDRDLPAGPGLIPVVAAVVAVVDRFPQARIAWITGGDDASPGGCPRPADLDLDVGPGLDVEEPSGRPVRAAVGGDEQV